LTGGSVDPKLGGGLETTKGSCRRSQITIGGRKSLKANWTKPIQQGHASAFQRLGTEIFSLSQTHRRATYLYIKKKKEEDPVQLTPQYNPLQMGLLKKKTASSLLNYCMDVVREENPLAPANSHRHLSYPACAKAATKLGAASSNTHLF
jgi:hypothetical protein